MKQSVEECFRTKDEKTFKLITKNGILLYCNPRCSFDDGVVRIENYRFELSAVRSMSVDKRTGFVTLDFTCDKSEELCEEIESVSEIAGSLDW